MSNDQPWSEITAQIKEQANIVDIIGECVSLKRSGSRFLGLCPFHGEKTASFSVHAGDQYYYCFGCKESGDVFNFLMKYHGLEFPQALKMVADRYHIALPEKRQSPQQEKLQQKRDELFRINDKAADLFSRYLKQAEKAKPARAYLSRRGIPAEIVEKYRIGYAPNVEAEGWNFLGSRLNDTELKSALEVGLVASREKGGTYDRFRDRIVFPIMDMGGRVCGFGGRITGNGQPKYLNSPESLVYSKSSLLLGLYQQKNELRQQKCAIFVEGNFDLVSLAARGVSNVVAPLGTALTREQLRLIKRYVEEVILLFDGDEAGINAAVRSVPLFLAEQLTGRIALLPTGHDPDTFVAEYGAQELRELLEKADGLPEFALEFWTKKHGMTLDGKRKIVEELQELLKMIPAQLQRSIFLSHFSEKLGFEKEQLLGLVQQQRHKQSGNQHGLAEEQSVKTSEAAQPLTIAQRQLVEFMVLQPQAFGKLENAGLRACLEGSTGEIIFLQLKTLVEDKPLLEPEELLTLLPPGEERKIVSEILLRAAAKSDNALLEQSRQELSDLLSYLQKEMIRKRAAAIMRELKKAQDRGDVHLVTRLLQEQASITRKMHG